MPIDQLKQETVHPGRRAGFLPQHSTASGPVVTGEENPLPVNPVDMVNGFSTTNISVTTTPVEITTGLTQRRVLQLYVVGDNAVYIGGSAVTSGDGFPLLPGTEKSFVFNPNTPIQIYAVADAQQSLRIFETN
jgi:hypothetical protein